jgi:hypothetical protein
VSLVENDHKQKHEPSEEFDPFLKFMFGNPQRETHKTSQNQSQHIPEQKEPSSFERTSTTNRIDDWFFGFPIKEPGTSHTTTPNQLEDLLNNVDFDLLMETMDMFVTTFDQYKPFFKEMTPYMHRLIKQFKSKKEA